MATVTKRNWTTPKGEEKSAWVVSWVTPGGSRKRKQFPTKRTADQHRIKIEHSILSGDYVAGHDRMTVADLAVEWLKDFETLVKSGKRERGTYDMYEQHIRLHIKTADVSGVKVKDLTGPDCANFAVSLENSQSDDMAKRVFRTFRAILDYGVKYGATRANTAKSIKIRTGGARVEVSGDDAGLYFPSKKELRKILEIANKRSLQDKGYSKALVMVLLFSGIRMSELRGLRWKDIDFDKAVISVRQRADQYGTIGPVKSAAAAREITVSNGTILALRHWKMSAPKSKVDLIFPNSAGNVRDKSHFYNRWWRPLMKDCKLVVAVEAEGSISDKPLFRQHDMRHAAISAWIAAGAKPKQVKEWAGHSSIVITFDRYGHLWPDEDQGKIAAEAEKIIIIK